MNGSRILRLVLMTIVGASAAVRADDPVTEAKGLVKRAHEKTDRGELDAAIADLDAAIRIDPKSPDAYEERGVIRFSKGSDVLAIEDFDRVIGLDPRRASAYLGRGVARALRKDTTGALADFDRAIALDSKSEEAFFDRAVIRKDKGDLDGAIADYTESIRLDSASFRSIYNRGRIWRAKHDVPRAIADFDEVIRLAPNLTIGYTNRGQCRGSAGDFDSAIVDFNAAIRLDPKLAAAYIDRGNAWRAKGEYDRAILDYDAAIRLDPTPPPSVAGHAVKYDIKSPGVVSSSFPFERITAAAIVQRGNCLRMLGRYKEALADFDRALRLDPEFTGPHVQRAWIWASCPDARFRDGPNAVDSARRACEGGETKNPYAFAALAAAQAETGEFGAAVESETKALALYEDEEDRKAAQSRLELYRARKPYRMSVYPGRPVPVAAQETPPPPPTGYGGPVRSLVNRILRK